MIMLILLSIMAIANLISAAMSVAAGSYGLALWNFGVFMFVTAMIVKTT